VTHRSFANQEAVVLMQASRNNGSGYADIAASQGNARMRVLQTRNTQIACHSLKRFLG